MSRGLAFIDAKDLRPAQLGHDISVHTDEGAVTGVLSDFQMLPTMVALYLGGRIAYCHPTTTVTLGSLDQLDG